MKLFKMSLMAVATTLILQGCGGDDGGGGLDPEAPPDSTPTLSEQVIGIWDGSELNAANLESVTFFPDGTYLFMNANRPVEQMARMATFSVAEFNDSNAEPAFDFSDGMEWGRYTIDNKTGELKITEVLFDSNGMAGLSGDHKKVIKIKDGAIDILVDENNDGVMDEVDESFVFSEIKSEGPNGFWKDDSQKEGLSGIAFMGNNTYVQVSIDASLDPNNSNNGMEWGEYSYLETTGELLVNRILVDQNGDNGLSSRTDAAINLKLSNDGFLKLGFDNNKDGVVSEDEYVNYVPSEKAPTTPIDNKELVGVWTNKKTDNELLAFVFFADGSYLHVEVDEQPPFDNLDNEPSGMEWGTYSFTNTPGALVINQNFDNNEQTGMSDHKDWIFKVDGQTLTLGADANENGGIEEDELVTFTKEKSQGLLGAWRNDLTGNELLALIFFEDGTYVHVEVDEKMPFDNLDDEPSGMEWGRYSLNPSTSELTVSIIFDQNAGTGLSDPFTRYAKVKGNTLTLEFDENRNNVIDKDESIDFIRQ